MAIVKMNKLSVIGLDIVKAKLIRELMDIGVVEINGQDGHLAEAAWATLVMKDGNETEVGQLEEQIGKTDLAINAITQYSSEKKPLFKTRKQTDWSQFYNVLEREVELEETVAQINDLYERINQLKNLENKLETERLALMPWRSHDVPLDLEETQYTNVMRGVLPASADPKSLEAEVVKQFDCCTVQVVGGDEEQWYISIICLKKEREDLLDLLKGHGFHRSSFQGIAGTGEENIERLSLRLSETEKERKTVESQIAAMQDKKGALEYFHDKLVMERDREKIRSRLLTTKRTFYLDGWLPKDCVEAVQGLLEENGCVYQVEEPKKEEETPVLLRNSTAVYPFEAVTNLYSIPNSKGIDPTAFFSFFYFLFFGMMLSDAVYGIIIAVVCFVLLKKYHLEGMAHRLVKMFFYCGISTILWGALFGGWLGNLVSVVGSTLFHVEIGIPPLWFDPIGDPMRLLVFSLILGIIHVMLGMALNAYMEIRDGQAFDAFCDVGLWYILFIGLGLFGLAGNLPLVAGEIGKWMSLIGGIGIILTGGRHNKGIGKITGGLGRLYGITGYLSDILSYSRLLALGLATGVIAQVINTMGSLVGGGIVGALVLFIVVVFGHTFNLAINALGSFVHSSRLQYVEFFGKFFIGGGEAFSPFRKDTKYIEIVGGLKNER